MLGQIAFRLEAEVAILACEGPNVGVGADMFLQHGGFLASDAAAVADVLSPPATPDVCVVVVSGLVAALYRSYRPSRI